MADAKSITGICIENSEHVPAATEKTLMHDGRVLIVVLTNPGCLCRQK
jgi:hypothetical protein